MNTINIIGAGPAGLTAAIILLRQGYQVTVYEKSPDVGYMLSGDFQGLENWSSDTDITRMLNSIGIDINFLCEPYYSTVVHARGVEPIEVRSERPLFYLVKRGPMTGTFDTGLKEQALKLGAELRFNTRLDEASGRAIVGSGPRRADFIAAGVTITTSMNDTALVALDNDIAPGGYAYLLVHGGQGTLATVLYRDYRRSRECLENAKRFFCTRMDADISNERRFSGTGNFFLRDTQVCDGKLYVGEAAGFQDYLWGFGVRYSILSGYLAARSIIEGSNYDDLWKEKLGPMLKTSLVNRFLFEKSGHTGHRYLVKNLKKGDACDYLKRLYNRSRTKSLILPLARRSYARKTEWTSTGFPNTPAGGAAGKFLL
jgi:flavin-dependent dehydrogenase